MLNYALIMVCYEKTFTRNFVSYGDLVIQSTGFYMVRVFTERSFGTEYYFPKGCSLMRASVEG